MRVWLPGLALVLACSTSDYQLTIDLEPDSLRDRLDHLVVEVRDSCAEGSAVRASVFVRPEEMRDLQLPLEPGERALAVDAVDAGCQVFASACTTFRAGSGDGARVTVQVTSTPERACEPGRCECTPGADAGPRLDGGQDGGSESDAGVDAPGEEDAGRDAGPPCSADYGAVITTQAPVAYYRFDDAAGSSVVQDERGTHFGTYDGTAPAPERVGGAIPGDDSGAVYFGYGPTAASAQARFPLSLDPALEGRPLTVSLWARMREVHDGRDHYTLFFFEVFDTYGFRLGYREDGRVVYFVNNSGGTGRLTTTEGHLGDGEWHHVVLRLLPGLAEIFVDGVSRGTWDADDGVPGGAADPTIGVGYVNGVHCDADIDELAIFDRSLSGAEIEAQYAEGTLCR